MYSKLPILLLLINSVVLILNRNEMCQQFRTGLSTIINQITDLDNEEMQKNLWDFSLSEFKIKSIDLAQFSDEKEAQFIQIMKDIEKLKIAYEETYHGKFPNASQFRPKIKQKSNAQKIIISEKYQVIKKLKADLEAKINIMRSIVQQLTEANSDVVNSIEYLKKIKSVQAELSTSVNRKDESFIIISKLSSLITSSNNLIGAKISQYSMILHDFNYLNNLHDSINNMKASFIVPKAPTIDAKLQVLINSKTSLESSLSSIKQELLRILNNEIYEISGIISQNQKFITYNSALKEAKKIKLDLLKEEKIFNEALEKYKDYRRDYALTLYMSHRICPLELIQSSNNISNISKILNMKPENYSDDLVNTPSYRPIVGNLFIQNEKIKADEIGLLKIAEEKNDILNNLLNKEKEVDVLFAEIWSTLQSVKEEGKLKIIFFNF